MAYPDGNDILDDNQDKPPLNGQRSGINPDALAVICALMGGSGGAGGSGGGLRINGIDPRTDQGFLFPVPDDDNALGVPMPGHPDYTSGFTLYMAEGDVVTGYFAPLDYDTSEGPIDSFTVTYDATDAAQIVDVPQAGGDRNFYVTNITGTPKAIWVQR